MKVFQSNWCTNIKRKLFKNKTYLVLCIKRLYNGHVFDPEISLPRIFPKEINQCAKMYIHIHYTIV